MKVHINLQNTMIKQAEYLEKYFESQTVCFECQNEGFLFALLFFVFFFPICNLEWLISNKVIQLLIFYIGENISALVCGKSHTYPY